MLIVAFILYSDQIDVIFFVLQLVLYRNRLNRVTYLRFFIFTIIDYPETFKVLFLPSILKTLILKQNTHLLFIFIKNILGYDPLL